MLPNTTTHSSRLVRPKDAAQLLGVSLNTVWRWARERADFPNPVKLGPASTAWRLVDLEEFIERRRLASF